ncbi:MAG: hypothetical protein D8B37_02370 [Candidatus Saccharimonas sp.]|jgi:hypothetical protein|nr:MAG: hypothetical protein D8B37_02370 [Candidatus Saccharimonas sp.]
MTNSIAYVKVYLLRAIFESRKIKIFDQNDKLVDETDKIFLASIDNHIIPVFADSRKEIENFINDNKDRINELAEKGLYNDIFKDIKPENQLMEKGLYLHHKLDSSILSKIDTVKNNIDSIGYILRIINNKFLQRY